MGVALDGDEAAWIEADRIAGGKAAPIQRLLRIQNHLGVFVAVALRPILARVIVWLRAGRVVAGIRLLLGAQVRGGFQLVVVVELNLAGTEPALADPVVEVLAIAPLPAAQWKERKLAPELVDRCVR